MATGVFGTKRSADFRVQDCEIFYMYSTDRATNTTEVLSLNPAQVLEKLDDPTDSGLILGGLYNLILPTSIFNKKGFYNIVIRPRRLRVRITDCGVLASKPDIRGVLFDLSSIPAEDVSKFENSNLIGYRIEYVTTNTSAEEKKIQNLFRIITSNNKVEPVSETLNNTNQKSVKYRLNDNSTLVFCTVTPSSAPSVRPNGVPFIGLPNQEVFLIPTTFDPIHLEIELVEHDFDTLAIGLFGNQTKAVADGTRTYYNENNQIYKQFTEYVIKDEVGAEKLYEVKEEKETIDFSKDFNNISNL
jgi:hypothetical protein